MNTWLPACICWSATVDSITASRILFQVTFIMLPEMSPPFLCTQRRSPSVRYQSAELVLIFREDRETSEHLHAAGRELLIGEINEVGYVWISSLGVHTRVRSRGRRGRSVFVPGAPVTRFSVACRRRDNVINGACWEQWRGWHGGKCSRHLLRVPERCSTTVKVWGCVQTRRKTTISTGEELGLFVFVNKWGRMFLRWHLVFWTCSPAVPAEPVPDLCQSEQTQIGHCTTHKYLHLSTIHANPSIVVFIWVCIH